MVRNARKVTFTDSGRPKKYESWIDLSIFQEKLVLGVIDRVFSGVVTGTWVARPIMKKREIHEKTYSIRQYSKKIRVTTGKIFGSRS